MLKLSASLKEVNIMSLRSGGPVALAIAPLINPHNLKIIGWWCKVPGYSDAQVLLVDDIRDINSKGIVINDEADLTEPEDLVRLQEILEIDYELIGKPVKTKNRKLGKVVDFSYNDGMFVQKLYVEKPLHRVFATEDVVLIDRTQILEVTDHYILVREGEIKAEEPKLAGLTAEPA